jgi:hypothetical protein
MERAAVDFSDTAKGRARPGRYCKLRLVIMLRLYDVSNAGAEYEPKTFLLTLIDETATVGDTRVEWERLVAKSLFAMAAR